MICTVLIVIVLFAPVPGAGAAGARCILEAPRATVAPRVLDDTPFDPDAVMKTLDLDGPRAGEVRKQLEAIKEVELEFLWQRAIQETTFAAGLGEDNDIDAMTARIAALARKAQKKIDTLADRLTVDISSASLPDLVDRGDPLFGRYRRPAPGRAAGAPRSARRTIESGAAPRSLDVAFDHDTHPTLKTGCVECHATNDRGRIEAAYARRPRSGNLLDRDGLIPTMDDCVECHYERGAIDDCALCHPGYRKDKRLFSGRFNPFLRLRNGVPAPDFSLNDLEGKRFSSASAKGRQFLVVAFGSSTCPPYLKEVAAVSALAAKYGAEPVSFLTIYTTEASPEIIGWERWLPRGQDEMVLRARACAETLSRFPIEDSTRVLVDQWPGVVSNRYGGLPNSVFIILPTGKIGWKAMRMVPVEVDAALEKLLWKHRP